MVCRGVPTAEKKKAKSEHGYLIQMETPREQKEAHRSMFGGHKLPSLDNMNKNLNPTNHWDKAAYFGNRHTPPAIASVGATIGNDQWRPRPGLGFFFGPFARKSLKFRWRARGEALGERFYDRFPCVPSGQAS
ncbi:hypothetical protein MAPG_10556 [Magnaporthiopsis poae ATCC 64411]|uniref:Uncharacterized protein n=1 Tax=Magnaporthiopsis poae (strain ATCC 64411 / 73-15) TaxID=644358 RepID=A0A0C4ECW7_MAGP6|nr:hypothetical protein MAPG_10556 [Magnaporthiopsis poae ATCC 64411]